MKEFKFKENKAKTLTVTIEGNEFSFVPNTYAVQNAIQFYQKRSNFIRNKYSKKTDQKNISQRNLEYIDLCSSTVNAILGKGSYKTIFENRPVDIEENDSVLNYIFESITEFCQKEIEKANAEHIDHKASGIN